ncbi:MAG TPA: alkaline phosphatase family protein [Marmoricola sp.]|nr:alkaline phosphatase family protein [Marmoricola sp.]
MRPTPFSARRSAVALLAAALAGTLAGCGGQAPAGQQQTSSARLSASTPTSTTSPATSATATSSKKVTKLLVFVVENHSYGQMKANMPFTWRLAKRFAHATDYHGIRHPSLPNYLAIAGGSTFGVSDDDDPSAHKISGRSVFGQALANGRTAKVYADGMPANCSLTSGGNNYAVKHNPWAYFVDERGSCNTYDVPVGALGTDVADGRLPNAGMVVPNLQHDAHDGTLAAADAWLKKKVNMVRKGTDWTSGRLAIVITADEDDDHHGNRVLTIVASRSTPHGRVVKKRLNHYSLTRLYDDVLGVGRLRHAKTAASMTKAFGVPVR